MAEEVKDNVVGAGQATKDAATEGVEAVKETASDAKPAASPSKPKFTDKIGNAFQQTSSKITGFFGGAKDKAKKTTGT